MRNTEESALLFDQAEIERWVQHRRAELAMNVHGTSTLALKVLASARATPARMLILSAREIRNPDERAGFRRPVTIVIRADDHPLGRVGAWDEQGFLCLEAELSPRVTLVIDRKRARLEFDRSIPETILSQTVGRPVGEVIHHPMLTCPDALILSADADRTTGRCLLSWAIRKTTYTLNASDPVSRVSSPPHAQDAASRG
ncbi:hypothetical protein [Sphingomonas sp. ABOLH]|uniref:hypothetical protein n=1 Tax=Sphingomonas sp. ABOLH TaxID=1985881 RepID=UPI000F7E7D31|nr:hypothetical protein [Sphingomonas sp. ABOLH]RSV27869.1 hypothetical protein CA237_10730 [Sphingomonas sp. ABOLH]